MKKNLINLITILSILMIFIISCQKEDLPDKVIVPDPPVPTTYTVDASVIDATTSAIDPVGTTKVLKGDNLSYKVTTKDGYIADSILINGVKVPLIDNSFNLSKVDTNYTIVVPSPRKSALEMELELLTSSPWKYVSSESRNVGDSEWINFPDKDWWATFIFSNDYTVQVFDTKDVLTGNGPYILKQDSLIIGPNPQGKYGIRNKILTLDKNNLKLRFVSKYIYTPGDPPGIKDVEF
jgi:hypothetical protein